MAMTLDLLRHGSAVGSAPGGDRQRRLTPEGMRGLEALAEHLLGLGWRPDRAFSSPVRRAQDSAAIVMRGATEPRAVEVLEALEPDAEPSEVLDALAALGVTSGHVLLVGHQPLLGRLVGHLTGAEKALSTGMLIRVSCPNGPDQGTGRIELTLAPGSLPRG